MNRWMIAAIATLCCFASLPSCKKSDASASRDRSRPEIVFVDPAERERMRIEALENYDYAGELAGFLEEDIAGWEVLRWDDRTGVIFIEAQVALLRRTDDVRIRITLDRNAQTRVDVESVARQGKVDFGRNARRIGRFLSRLDEATEAQGDQILPREYARSVVAGRAPAA